MFGSFTVSGLVTLHDEAASETPRSEAALRVSAFFYVRELRSWHLQACSDTVDR